jgi:glycosyltransferase involved in cell wall biosynthesis
MPPESECFQAEVRAKMGNNGWADCRQQPQKPKLVQIIARLNVGGAARHVCLVHELLEPHFRNSLIFGSLAVGEEDMSYLVSSQRNAVRSERMSREISVLADFVTFYQLFRILRKERPDIVHTHTAKAGALGRLVSFLVGVPIIVHTYHGHVFHGYFGRLKTKVYIAIERLLGRISTRIVALSESQKLELCETYRIAPPSKISVITLGFDLASFVNGSQENSRTKLGLPKDRFVVAWAGRMAPVKDVRLLAQLIRLAGQRENSNIHFLVVGDGTERREFEHLVQDCSNVSLLGWQRDMALIWSAADVALVTSLNEGTPVALIEAMAAGRPFVSTNVGGVRDLAVDPIAQLPDGMGCIAANGFLTSRCPEALLHCIEELARNPPLAKAMASAGRRLVFERYTTRHLVAELRTLYQTLLDEQHDTAR